MLYFAVLFAPTFNCIKQSDVNPAAKLGLFNGSGPRNLKDVLPICGILELWALQFADPIDFLTNLIKSGAWFDIS